MPSSNKIQVYLPVDILEKLKSEAAKQNRSASNLAASLVIQAINTPNYEQAIELLKTLAKGESPSDAAIILAAHEVDELEPEELFDLRDRLSKKGKQPNGI